MQPPRRDRVGEFDTKEKISRDSRETESRKKTNKMEGILHRELFNTSWNLHRLSPLHHGKEFATLLNNQVALKAYATRLRDQLTGDVLAGLHIPTSTTEDETLSRTGSLIDCRWEFLSTKQEPRKSSLSGILVTLEYENITCKAALLTDSAAADDAAATASISATKKAERSGVTILPLLLTKFPTALRQTFITFLQSTFDAYCSNLRLSSAFLCTGLEIFLEELRGSRDGASADHLVEEVLKDLQLSLAFSSSIAPALRNLSVNIARDSLVGFLQVPSEVPVAQRKPKSILIANLSAYLEKHLAMKVDLDGSLQNKVSRQHVRLAKVACAAFVLGSEGRMKLVVGTAQMGEDDDEERRVSPSVKASETLLRAIIRKATLADLGTT